MKSYSNSLFRHEIPTKISSSGNVSLEARIFPGNALKNILVIITHPYGPLGGNLDNNVVNALFQIFASKGFMTARFNFRGVGNSTGRTTFAGTGEIDDVTSVYKYIKRRSDLAPQYTIIAGYSYGSISACAASNAMEDLIGIISISYPCAVSWALTLWNSRKYANALQSTADIPKLFIIGDKDNFTSATSFKSFTNLIPEPKTVTIVPNVDHFWLDSTDTICGIIRQWINNSLDVKKYQQTNNSTLSPKKITTNVATVSHSDHDLHSKRFSKDNTDKLNSNSAANNWSLCKNALCDIDVLLDQSESTLLASSDTLQPHNKQKKQSDEPKTRRPLPPPPEKIQSKRPVPPLPNINNTKDET